MMYRISTSSADLPIGRVIRQKTFAINFAANISLAHPLSCPVMFGGPFGHYQYSLKHDRYGTESCTARCIVVNPSLFFVLTPQLSALSALLLWKQYLISFLSVLLKPVFGGSLLVLLLLTSSSIALIYTVLFINFVLLNMSITLLFSF